MELVLDFIFFLKDIEGIYFIVIDCWVPWTPTPWGPWTPAATQDRYQQACVGLQGILKAIYLGYFHFLVLDYISPLDLE